MIGSPDPGGRLGKDFPCIQPPFTAWVVRRGFGVGAGTHGARACLSLSVSLSLCVCVCAKLLLRERKARVCVRGDEYGL